MSFGLFFNKSVLTEHVKVMLNVVHVYEKSVNDIIYIIKWCFNIGHGVWQ